VIVQVREQLRTTRPPAVVTRWLAEGAAVPAWDPDAVYSRPLDDGPPRVGRQHLLVERSGRRRVRLLFTLDALVEGRQVRLSSHRWDRLVRWDFDVTPVSDGADVTWRTEVTFARWADVRRPVAERVLRRRARRAARHLQEFLDGSLTPG
jgi:hypothetical protein